MADETTNPTDTDAESLEDYKADFTQIFAGYEELLKDPFRFEEYSDILDEAEMLRNRFRDFVEKCEKTRAEGYAKMEAQVLVLQEAQARLEYSSRLCRGGIVLILETSLLKKRVLSKNCFQRLPPSHLSLIWILFRSHTLASTSKSSSYRSESPR